MTKCFGASENVLKNEFLKYFYTFFQGDSSSVSVELTVYQKLN